MSNLPQNRLSHRHKIAALQILHQIVHGLAPESLLKPFALVPQFFAPESRLDYLSYGLLFQVPSGCRSSRRFKRSFSPSTFRLWNSISADIRNVVNPSLFRLLQRFLMK